MKKARYTLTTIITSDEKLIELSVKVRKETKATHEDIYRAGVEFYLRELENIR